MNLPLVLLVDDSEAVLEFGRAALSRHYRICVAHDGVEALRVVQETNPDCILLDLSMPVMDGDETLDRLKEDPLTAQIPVVILSSEVRRADACLKRGATLALHKPASAVQLVGAVVEALERANHEAKLRGAVVLPMRAGDYTLATPLDLVQGAHFLPLTLPLPAAPGYLREAFDLWGQLVPILDLAARLGTTHKVEVSALKLVVVKRAQAMLALCVDEIGEPSIYPSDRVVPASELDGHEGQALGGVIRFVVRTDDGMLPVVDPWALLPRGAMLSLPAWLAQAKNQATEAR